VIVLRKLLALTIFLLAIFLMVEISYRFYVMGLDGFNLRKVNSMNTLMRSEFVQLSKFPDVFFELKPNMKGLFKSKSFATNSVGLADKEYALDKPQDVFRAAVVGSSWTMASGVEQQESWHALIEHQRAESEQAQSLEIINFGVEMYGLGEIVGTVRHKVLDWQPDVVIAVLTTFTTSFVWEKPVAEPTLPPRAYPAFNSFALRSLSPRHRLGLETNRAADDRKRFDPNELEPRLAQLQRALAELGHISQESGVPIAVVFLGYFPLGDRIENTVIEQADNIGLTVIYANRLFMDIPNLRPYQISNFDRHPNAAGHQLIADFLAVEMVDVGVLPPAVSR
jgi:hypothetical protein